MAELQQNVREVVDTTANDIQDRASAIAPRRTGAMANSIYVNNGENSDYSTRVSIAAALNRDMQALEEIDPEFVIMLNATPGARAYIAVVGVAAHYGAAVELGTVNQRAQPYLLPAAEVARNDFETSMSHVADNL